MTGTDPAVEKLDTRSPSSTRSLLLRIISAALLIPMVLFAVGVGGRAFAALVAFLCIVMVFEWTRMVERAEFTSSFYTLAIAAAIALYLASSGLYGPSIVVCSLSGVVAFILAKRNLGLGFWSAITAPYIIAPCIALLWLRSKRPGRGGA